MIPAKRIDYSPIIDRPALKAPKGVRVIVWPIVNVEVWDIGRPMPRQALPPPTGQTMLPDVPHWSWHEYGNRVGFWRIKAALDALDVKATLAINGRICEDYPRIAEESLKSGWDFMGHSYDQRPIHLEPNQGKTIRRTVKILSKFSGKPVLGWLSPGLTETLDTPELLVEAGIRYSADWVIDDEPCEIRTRKGPLVTLPYTVELNDISMMMIQHHAAGEFLQRSMDTFERLHDEGRERVKVMAIAVHPYISGVPHRIKYFETVFQRLRKQPGVAFWTGEQILAWYQGTRRKTARRAR